MSLERRNDLLALALLTSLVTALFIDVLAGANILYSRDLLHYLYPSKKVVREVVLGGEFPYWNRAIGAGQPLAANPAHEIFYPLTWLILLPSYDYGFQLFILVHLYIAAWAMYALLRSLALGRPASFFGALSFALGGMMLSYLNLLPILAAAVWIPLVLLFVRRFLLHRTWRDFALASVAFAVQLLIGEPTTILQTGLLAGLYAIHHGLRRGGAPEAARCVLAVGAISLAALLVGAVAVLPAADHAGDSVRARGFPFATVTDWSTPPLRVAELLYPHLLGHHQREGRRLYWGAALYEPRGVPFLLSIYPGLLVSVLAVAGALARIRGTRLFVAAAAVSLLLALGAYTPLWQLLYESWLARAVRYPEKFLLMGVFGLTVFGAKALELLLRGDERVRAMALRVSVAVTAVAAVAAIVALSPLHARLFAAAWHPPRDLFAEMLSVARTGWVVAAARGLLLLVLLRAVSRARRPAWLVLAGLFAVLDLALLVPELAPRTTPAYLRDPPAVLTQLPPGRDRYRLFHHAAWHRAQEEVGPYYRLQRGVEWVRRNSAMPLLPAAHGVQTVLDGDYDFTALLPTADFVAAVRELSDRTPHWLPLAASMSNAHVRAVYIDPAEAFAHARGDLRRVQPVGLLPLVRTQRYFFARRLETVRGTREFIDKAASGRFGLETAFIDAPSFAPAPGRVHAWRETANGARIDVETAGRAFLVMSVTPHKYWTITIDGEEVPAVVTNVGFQGVVVPRAGRHVIEMRYRNPLVAAGAAISAAALLVLALLARIRPA